MFGFVDIVAIKEGHKPQFIQTTTNPHSTDRRRKVLARGAALVAIRTGIDVVIHGWKAPTLVKRKHWSLGIYPVTEDMFAASPDALDSAASGDGGLTPEDDDDEA